MKDKKLTLTIRRYDMIGGVHWYVTTVDCKVFRKFNRYKDAREFALSRAYARNIETID